MGRRSLGPPSGPGKRGGQVRKRNSAPRLGAPVITVFRDGTRALQFRAPAGSYWRFEELVDGRWTGIAEARIAQRTTPDAVLMEGTSLGAELLSELFAFESGRLHAASLAVGMLATDEEFMAAGVADLAQQVPG